MPAIGSDFNFHDKTPRSAPVQRSLFDLSYTKYFDVPNFGMLIPCYLEDLVPGDEFTISNDVVVRAMPMEVPLMSKIKVYTHYYFVPYRMLWHKFPLWLFGGVDGKYEAEVPTIAKLNSNPKVNSLFDYFQYPLANADKDYISQLSAFPFAAYQRIYRDYYLYKDLLSEAEISSWMLDKPNEDVTLVDGPNKYFNTESSVIALDAGRYRNWRADYFTSAKPWPQRGDTPVLQAVGDISLSASQSYLPNSVMMNSGSTYRPALILRSGNTFPAFYGLRTSGVDDESTNNSPLFLNMSNIVNNINVSDNVGVSITMDALRTLSQIQLWLERNARVAPDFRSQLLAHYGIAPQDETLEIPLYIGGSDQTLIISEVLMQSASSGDGIQTKQGNMSGHGVSMSGNFVGKYRAKEHGLIMGLLSIMPDTVYSQGIRRQWTRTDKTEFYFPEFSQLGMQEIKQMELYYSFDSDVDNKRIWGFQGRYDEMRSRFDEYSGKLRDPAQKYWFAWTQGRYFTEAPQLNNVFVKSGSYYANKDSYNSYQYTVRHDAFSVPTESLFVVAVQNHVRAVRPLPYENIPIGL